jgi:nicotinamide riboside kinase
VPDEMRFLGGDKKRQDLHNELKQMYIDRGFGKKIIEIGGSYNKRLTTAVKLIDQIIEGKR